MPNSFSVLIVDDEKSFVQTLKEALEREGTQVFVAHTTNEALLVFGAHKDVRAISFDGQLPIRDGGEIDPTGESAAQLVMDIKEHNPKATLIAASGSHTIQTQLRDAGCTNIVFNKQDLLQIFRQLKWSYERHGH